MNNNCLVRRVYDELSRLHELGLTTWVSRVWKLVQEYNVNISYSTADFKSYCKILLENDFKQKWELSLNDVDTNPILVTYSVIKTNFGLEEYLNKVNNFRYRHARTKIRTSSHGLETKKEGIIEVNIKCHDVKGCAKPAM